MSLQLLDVEVLYWAEPKRPKDCFRLENSSKQLKIHLSLLDLPRSAGAAADPHLEPWGCSEATENCIEELRRLLSCERIRSLETGSVDWLAMREQMRKALARGLEEINGTADFMCF